MTWLSDVKKGRYRGIQEAGLLYSYAEKYPQYIELSIHELMEKLNEDNFNIRKNAYWMISKISEQYKHHNYLIPIIPILAFGIKEENEKIKKFSLKTILNLSDNIPRKISYLKQDLIIQFENLSKENQVLILKILINIAKKQEVSLPNEFILKYLNEKHLVPELIELLIHKKSYKTIFPTLINNLQHEKLQSHVFQFIERACEIYPFKIILALKKSLVKFDPFIRQNSLLIFRYLKKNSKIYLLLPEILQLINSKIHTINRISIFLLYDIHDRVIKELFFYISDLYDLRKQGDKVIKNVINSILVKMAAIDIKIILLKIKKKVIKQLKSCINIQDIRLRTIAILGYTKIMIWENDLEKINDSVNEAINICLTLVKEYPISEYKFEVFYRIGLYYFYLHNFQKSGEYFKKSLQTGKDLEKTYQSSLFLIIINFIRHLPKTALEIREGLIAQFEESKIQSKEIKSEFEIWNTIFEDFYHFKIEQAKSKYELYYSKNIINNKTEKYLHSLIRDSFDLIKKI